MSQRKGDLSGSPLVCTGLPSAVSRASRKLAASTIGVHHAVLNRALKKAARDRLVLTNPVSDVDARLRAHKVAQSEPKMRNRTAYLDLDLVFAREHEHLHLSWAQLGQPTKALSERAFGCIWSRRDSGTARRRRR